MPLKHLKIGHKPDYFLMAAIFAMGIFGLAMLASASSELCKSKFNDSYYYLKHQIVYGLSFGIVGFIFGYFVYFRRLRKFAFPLLLFGIFSLALVFTNFGVEVRGSNRWVSLGPISFQPSALMKLAFIIYLAAWLGNPKIER